MITTYSFPVVVGVLTIMLVAAHWFGPGIVMAQTPVELYLVNNDRNYVERTEKGGFLLRPVFNKNLWPDHDGIHMIIRDQGGTILNPEGVTLYEPAHEDFGLKIAEGFEHTVEYKNDGNHNFPVLDPEEPYLLIIWTQDVLEFSDNRREWEAMIPVYEPTGLWADIRKSVNPATWVRNVLMWGVKGAHALTCSMLGKIVGGEVENCGPLPTSHHMRAPSDARI